MTYPPYHVFAGKRLEQVIHRNHVTQKQPDVSLVFPHVENQWNDACLKLKLEMLRDNTTCCYEVLYICGTKAHDVYPAWNALIERALAPVVVWDNSDLLYAPRWNESILRYIDDADWLCLRSVECGALGVAESNIDRNFGRTAETFNREAFERFCEKHASEHPEFEPDRFGWYAPSAFRRQWFIDMGGFDCDKYPPFPFPVDSKFREKVTEMGCRFATVSSYAAHLQFARENMGEKTSRNA